MELNEEKVFKDPVHKYIYVQDRIVWDLIDTKEFQRLRRIRQLGTSYLTFHGAEHSRFSHSLGVYEITRKIINEFERHHEYNWSREEKLICLCAALLHDVGHGPFSHSIEAIFPVDHEEWSRRLILADTEIHRVLSRVSSDFPEKVAAVIAKQSPLKIAVSLISSPLDADRMDYLLRDAYYTGVNYGTFDLERILRVLRPRGDGIVVKESGMHAVEDYLMSRYQMYWQVYFHPVTRGSEAILQNILRRASELYHDGYGFAWLPDPLPALFKNELTTADYVRLDEAFMQTVFTLWCDERDPILADLCRRFVYRRLFQYRNVKADEPFRAEAFYEYVRACGLDPAYYVSIDNIADFPYDIYRPHGGDGQLPILLLMPNGELEEISTRSEVVRSISGTQVGGKGKNVYYPADLVQVSDACWEQFMAYDS